MLSDFITPAFRQSDLGSESLVSTLAKHSMDFGEPERFKFAKRVHLRIDADTDIDFSLRVGGQATTEDPIAWCTPQTVNSNSGFANVLCMGRYISFELSTTTVKTFKVTGVDIEAELRGYH